MLLRTYVNIVNIKNCCLKFAYRMRKRQMQLFLEFWADEYQKSTAVYECRSRFSFGLGILYIHLHCERR